MHAFFAVQYFVCRHHPVDMAKSVLLVCLFLQFVFCVASEDRCIAGTYHKSSPSPETSDFKTCYAFKNSSCCTAAFTVELVANETRNLYNHSWHRCGQLSEKCQEFWVKQVSVFISCSFKVFNRSIYSQKTAEGESFQEESSAKVITPLWLNISYWFHFCTLMLPSSLRPRLNVELHMCRT